MAAGIFQRKDRANIEDRIQFQLLEGAEIKRLASEVCKGAIRQAFDALAKAFSSSGKLLLYGNGGSAADCQHLAADFLFGFEHVFEVQVNALGSPGDVLMVISTSGNSLNVIAAAEAARKKGMKVVGLLSRGGGRLKELVDVAITVPSNDTMRIQEAYIAIGHILCNLISENISTEAGLVIEERLEST